MLIYHMDYSSVKLLFLLCEKAQNCSFYVGATFMTPDYVGSINRTPTKENDTFSETSI